MTKNTFMYNTEWGPVYVPKTVAAAEGVDEETLSVKFTFEKVEDAQS